MNTPIGSLKSLGWVLGVPIERVQLYADTVKRHYSSFLVPKPNRPDLFRTIHVPNDALKDIQQRIYIRVLRDIPLPETVHGGVRRRSPTTNARQHLHKPCLVRMDVKSCFPSIKPHLVNRLFTKHLRFHPDVARTLTKLTTLNHELPQGVSTSTALANLIISYECERDFEAVSIVTTSTNTRFVDDLFFSGEDPTGVINEVIQSLKRIGLAVSHEKLDVMHGSQRQEVTGLTVNRKEGPSVPRKKHSKIRAAINKLDPYSRDFERQKESVLGRISYVRQTNPGAAIQLTRYLESSLVLVRQT